MKGDKNLPVSNATQAGPYWSLMFEISENKDFKPVNLATIVEVGVPNFKPLKCG